MSLYNILFGQNADAGHLLRLLETSESKVPRFRDCYWDGDYIVIYTRTGGGNRDYYESEEACRENYAEYFNGADGPSGPWNSDLRSLPGFSHDEDDECDKTYASFYFKPPSKYLDALSAFPPDATPAEKWQALFDAMNKAGTIPPNSELGGRGLPADGQTQPKSGPGTP